MNKNKILSIIILIFIIILALGIGIFFSYKSGGIYPRIETMTNIDTNWKPDENILFKQMNNIYLFMYLFYSDIINTQYSNLYNTMISNSKDYNATTESWDKKYRDHGLLRDTLKVDITNFLSYDFYYYSFNNYDSIQYNITNGLILKDYLTRLYRTLTEHSESQIKSTILHQAKLSYDYTDIKYIQLVEFVYVYTFVPTALYEIYNIPFNKLKVYYSGVIDDNTDLNMFQTLYTSADQMNILNNITPINRNLIDKNGRLLVNKGFIQSTSRYIAQDNANVKSVHEYMNQILYIYKDPIFIDVLESSYCSFYKALIYFAKKFSIPIYTGNNLINYDNSIYDVTIITNRPTPNIYGYDIISKEEQENAITTVETAAAAAAAAAETAETSKKFAESFKNTALTSAASATSISEIDTNQFVDTLGNINTGLSNSITNSITTANSAAEIAAQSSATSSGLAETAAQEAQIAYSTALNVIELYKPFPNKLNTKDPIQKFEYLLQKSVDAARASLEAANQSAHDAVGYSTEASNAVTTKPDITDFLNKINDKKEANKQVIIAAQQRAASTELTYIATANYIVKEARDKIVEIVNSANTSLSKASTANNTDAPQIDISMTIITDKYKSSTTPNSVVVTLQDITTVISLYNSLQSQYNNVLREYNNVLVNITDISSQTQIINAQLIKATTQKTNANNAATTAEQTRATDTSKSQAVRTTSDKVDNSYNYIYDTKTYADNTIINVDTGIVPIRSIKNTITDYKNNINNTYIKPRKQSYDDLFNKAMNIIDNTFFVTITANGINDNDYQKIIFYEDITYNNEKYNLLKVNGNGITFNLKILFPINISFIYTVDAGSYAVDYNTAGNGGDINAYNSKFGSSIDGEIPVKINIEVTTGKSNQTTDNKTSSFKIDSNTYRSKEKINSGKQLTIKDSGNNTVVFNIGMDGLVSGNAKSGSYGGGDGAGAGGGGGNDGSDGTMPGGGNGGNGGGSNGTSNGGDGDGGGGGGGGAYCGGGGGTGGNAAINWRFNGSPGGGGAGTVFIFYKKRV
jgi:hypothetical protein